MQSEPFPQPKRKDGGEPCGECHIQPGETCDICGAVNHPSPSFSDAVVEACAKVAEGPAIGWGEFVGGTPERDKIAAAIRALKGTFPAAPEAKSEVAVKPIDWGKTSYGTPEAYTVAGVYRITEAWSGGWAVAYKTDLLRDLDGRTNFATIEAAKAAAQQHYETRLRSALVDPEGGV